MGMYEPRKDDYVYGEFFNLEDDSKMYAALSNKIIFHRFRCWLEETQEKLYKAKRYRTGKRVRFDRKGDKLNDIAVKGILGEAEKALGRIWVVTAKLRKKWAYRNSTLLRRRVIGEKLGNAWKFALFDPMHEIGLYSESTSLINDKFHELYIAKGTDFYKALVEELDYKPFMGGTK